MKSSQHNFNILNGCMIILVLLLMPACQLKEKTDAVAVRNETSVDSSNSSEQEKLESQDRTIWQKPYDIIGLLGPLEDKVIADIGAGSGYFSFRFIHQAKKVKHDRDQIVRPALRAAH